jgi:cytoskeletal protein RodZ
MNDAETDSARAAEAAALAEARAILFAPERERLGQLEAQARDLAERLRSADAATRAQGEALLAEVQALRRRVEAEAERLQSTEGAVAELRRLTPVDTAGVVRQITPALNQSLTRNAREARDEMAEALAPVMGEAIRTQIRESRSEMIEALYPIIGSVVQRALSEFARELQRNIDARLRAAVGPQGALRSVVARLRGVSESELALRDALPFSLHDLVLIQRGSGLLLAHYHSGHGPTTDADLISGMLTAIRHFVRDSFSAEGEERELDEIDYGEQHIILQGGESAYIAAVFSGIEPTGFRAQLRQFVADLHLRHNAALRAYAGEADTLPALEPQLKRLAGEAEAAVPTQPTPLPRHLRPLLALGALIGVLVLAIACFYLQFTWALLPLAFPRESATPLSSATTIALAPATATVTPTLSATAPPTATARATATTTTAAATVTPSATATAAATARPASTGVTTGAVWVRSAPALSAPTVTALPANTVVTVHSVNGNWVEVEWSAEGRVQRGWVSRRWLRMESS